MPPSSAPSPARRHTRLLAWFAWLGILGVFVALRARGVGHLLMWDEAMDLCSVRAFVTSSRDAFSNAFWAHPPLFPLMMAWLEPLRAGFAERAQGLAIGVQAVNLLVLFLLNRRLFGMGMALLTCAALACLPGAVFFDVWIKRDHLVVCFGLLALFALEGRRVLTAGILLGAALLSKESALFFVIAILLLVPWVFEGRERWKNTAGILVVAAAASAWWYACFSILSRTYIRFALGRDPVLTGWNQPWTYYVQRLWTDLGPVALCVLAAGGAAAAVGACRDRSAGARRAPEQRSPVRFWPLALLIPAYVYLALARGKAPWLTMVLYPAWATLIGLAVHALLQVAGRRIRAVFRPVACAMIAAVALGALFAAAWSRDYSSEQARLGFGQQWGASVSRQTAGLLNRLVEPGQRVLITPFYYWGDDPILTPCPIFSYYLKPMPVLLASFHITPEAFVQTVRANRIDWAMLAPPPGTGETSLLQPLIQTHGLVPRVLPGAVVFSTSELWRDERK